MKKIPSKLLSLLFLVFVATVSYATAQSSDTVAGIALYREGKYAEAVQKLELAVAADKNDRQAQTYLGASYLQTKNRKKARSAFLTASGIKSAKSESESPTTESDRSKTLYKIISNPRARVPSSSDSGVQYTNGRATLAVELLPNGRIGFVHIVKNTVPPWESILLAAARGIKFEPATENGKNVVSIITVEYSYDTF